MDDGSPLLGVGFAIDPEDSFATLRQLEAAMGTTEAKIVAEAAKIEKATGGMLNLAGGTAQITSFGNAASRELAQAARTMAQTEKAGEALSRQLDKQASTFGKTREELRQMKVETAALAAEQQGLTELAERLRSQEQTLYDMEFAAMRKASGEAKSLAEDKAIAAQQAVAAAEREAQSLREAAQAYQMFEAAARDGIKAMREVEAIEKASKADAHAQSIREAAHAYQMFQARAREAGDAWREQEAARQSAMSSAESYAAKLESEAAAIGRTTAELRAMEVAHQAAAAEAAGLTDEADRIREAGAAYAQARDQVEAMTTQERQLAEASRQAAEAAREAAAAQVAQDASLSSLRGSVDPLYASQQRLARELENAVRLYHAGAIGQDEYERSSMALASRLDDVQRAQLRQVAGMDDVRHAAGLSAADLTNVAFQVQDIFVSLAGGQNPMLVIMQQGAQLSGIMMQTGASAGTLAKAMLGLAIVTTPTAAATLALATAQTDLVAAQTGAASAGTRAAIAQAELAVTEEAATRAGIADAIAQQRLALAQSEVTATAEIATAANSQLAAAEIAAGLAAQNAARTATRALAPWLAMVIAIAAPLAVAGVALDRWKDKVDDDAHLKSYVAGLGLTTQELKKMEDVSITAGDAMHGLWATIEDRLNFKFDGQKIIDYFFSPNDAQQIGNFVAQIYGLFVGGYKDIVAVWGLLPSALGDLFARAANLSIKTIERMVNASIDAINGFAARANDLLGVQMFGDIGRVAIDRVTNQYEGASSAAIDAIGKHVREETKKANAAMSDFAADVGRNTTEAAQARLKKQRDAIVADRTPKTDRHAEQLAREAAAVEAQIRNLYGLADAYQVSGAAALVAEARVKAESQAIKKRGDIDAAVDRQIRLAIAQRVSDAAKSTAASREQVTAQNQVNAMVAAGLASAERAAELVRDRIADLPLLAAIEVAQQRGLVEEVRKSTKQLTDQQKVRDDLRKAQATDKYQTSMFAGDDRLAELREEMRLIGATDEARVRALATLKATQEAKKSDFNPDEAANYVKMQVAIAVQTQQLTDAQRAYNDSLTFAADQWDQIARNVDNAATGMADAFGKVGQAIGDMASTYANFHADRARLNQQHLADIREAGTDQARIDRANAKFALATATSQIGLFGDMTSAAKGFFKEGSSGYKALEAAEKAFRAVEFALSVRAMAQDAIHTVTSIANSGFRTAQRAVEAVVSAISSLPFPLNLAAGAATIAALASIGVGVAGSFGGSKNTLEKANDGTGTVLGDSSAKSDSIKRSIDSLKEVDTLMLGTSRDMLASLRSIESSIGGFAALLVRSGDINASGGVDQGFKSNAIGSILGSVPLVGGILKGLFGTKTKVIGSGLFGGAQSLEEILGGGFDASYYSDVEKKKKLFGLTTSKKYSTQYGAADPELENQFTLILRQFNDAILAASGPLGAATQDIKSKLNGFVVDIGKIDLQGMTGEEIKEKLSAVFGAAADDMAKAAFPGLERFQAVGEGMFETLVRVASTVESVTSSLTMLGSSASTMGIDVKMVLAGQFESVSDFTSAADSYFETYYTKAEQAAARTAQFADVFDGLGMSMPTTLAAFRSLVEAQDLTTAAGQATYATLLQLAPAFADLQASMNGAKSAADILSERSDLERKLLETQGDTAAIRALDLAQLDESNRALQQQIWALQDAKEAADAAQQLKDAWSSVGDSIMDEVNRIRGISDGSGTGSFASLMGQFNTAVGAAKGGDQDAASSLPGLSQALLQAAQLTATSRQELERVKAQTASTLESVFASIMAANGHGSGVAKGVGAPTGSILEAAATAAQIASGPSVASANDNMAAEIRALRDEVAQLRSDNNAGHAATASNTGAIKRKLDDVTAASGGEAISVAGVAA